MLRERVITIFSGLLIFTLAVFLIQINTEKGFTGSIVSDFINNIPNSSDVSEDFSLEIDKYDLKNGKFYLTYSVEDRADRNHDLEVNYFVHDEAARVLESGKENVFLERRKDMDYQLSFPYSIKGQDLYLTLLVSDDKSEARARVKLSLPYTSITGKTVSSEQKVAFNYFLVLFFMLALLFYGLKVFFAYNLKKKIRESSSGRFIQIHR
jgi:hypothetical protein